ncbi:MobP2 family relaxase [Enterococcus sp. AZ072]|uniref:MobP2 family relaxase n=1 Tax=unclassified Enterococcus TaxID=2608891 RepID=UPI003D26BA90
MASPAIILTSEFTVKNNYGSYISYMDRERAKEKNLKKLTIEKEAEDLLAENFFQTQNFAASEGSFENYLNYLSRKTALEKKAKLTPDEQMSYQFVTNRLTEIEKNQSSISAISKENDLNKLKTGMFNQEISDMKKREVQWQKKIFSDSGKKGCVLFKDVFSFDTNHLIKLGIYDPVNDHLNRQPLIQATRKAMAKMLKQEKLSDTTVWVGEIHYNTKHFHIHVATTEQMNTRKDKIVVSDDGEMIKQPRGKRKLSTLNSMKTTFMNSLLDRSTELEKISALRNDLVNTIREQTDLKSNQKMIAELIENMPASKKEWVYKRLSSDNKERVDKITEYLLKDNPKYQEYKHLLSEEGRYRNSLYNKNDSQNDYLKNQSADVKKRLGNALLKNLKTSVDEYKKESIKQKENSKESGRKKFFREENIVPTLAESFNNNLNHYSKHNRKMILDQMPEATHVRTKFGWLAEKRNIVNENPIVITRPILKHDKIIGFEPLEVFDISQTTKFSISREFSETEKLDRTEPISEKFSALKTSKIEENLKRFSAGNRAAILKQCPKAKTVFPKWEWFSKGYKVNDSVEPLIISAPLIDKATDKVLGFKEVEVYDISQVSKMTSREHREIKKNLEQMRKKYEIGQSDSYKDIQLRDHIPVDRKIQNNLKQALNNEFERQQQLREFEKMQQKIEQIKQQQDFSL